MSRIDEIAKTIPELPQARANRFVKQYGITEYQAKILTSRKDIADYFEECCIYMDKIYNKEKAC